MSISIYIYRCKWIDIIYIICGRIRNQQLCHNDFFYCYFFIQMYLSIGKLSVEKLKWLYFSINDIDTLLATVQFSNNEKNSGELRMSMSLQNLPSMVTGTNVVIISANTIVHVLMETPSQYDRVILRLNILSVLYIYIIYTIHIHMHIH